MWKATIRGLLARRIRLVVTALAVVIGVSFVSATYVLTDTVKRSFDAVFRQTVSGVDLLVEGPPALGSSGQPERIPESTLAAVRAVPGVARAEGSVTGYAQFVGRDGDSIGGGGPPTFGVSWVDHGPLRLADDGVSRPPRGPREVLMDEGTARANGFAVGDRVRVLLSGPAQKFRVVGLFGFGEGSDFGRVTFAAFDLATAQRVLQADGVLDRVYVQAARVPVDQLRRRIEHALGPGYDVLDPEQAALRVGQPVRDFLGYFTYALLGFALIGVVIGAFIIFNTFSILVAQRTRELGLLRAMGATGGQVVSSVMLEALVVGAVASVIGLVSGIALGVGLLALLRELGLDLPPTTTVVLARTIAVSLFVGVGVTVAAAVVPGVRAARVSPIAAIDGIRARTHGGLRRRLVVGGLIIAVGFGVLAWGVARADHTHGLVDQAEVVAAGAFTVLVGVVILLATVVRPLARFLGRPLTRFAGVTGSLARENAMRDPRRTAVTASALVIGLALVGLTATFGASARASVRSDTGTGLRADDVVRADGLAGFSTDVGERLRDVPQLAAVVPMRFNSARIGGHVETVGAADPATVDEVVDLDYVQGSAPRPGSIAVSERSARELGVRRGDVLAVQFPRLSTTMKVDGIYRNKNFIGPFGQSVPFLVSRESADQGFGGSPQDTLVLVRAEPGERGAARAAMRRALGDDFPNIEVVTRDEFRDEQTEQVDQFLSVLVALLALSAIVAILGIVNTLALSVFERTRELGLLRVVGMSRAQVRGMIRGESVVIALIGGSVGLAVGLLWGWAFASAFASQGISVFRVPFVQVVVFLVASMLAGVLAAVVPSWRAARLDVLEAIATE